jgi:type II secretory pathway component PulL
LNVSKQINEKIIKGEYMELENLLPVSLSDSNMQNTRSRHIAMGPKLLVIVFPSQSH